MIRHERETTNENFLAFIAHPDSFCRRARQFGGVDEWNTKFDCACHDCFREGMFRFALRDTGSGVD
jgi:hypothetical protein